MATESAEINQALLAALADLTLIENGRTVTVDTKGGGSYSYDYAQISDVVRITRPALAAQGIVALTPIHAHGDGLACTVVLLHTSGERLDFGPFPFPAGRDAQATGSMVTYHRRYALVAALGLATGDDDDGQSATRRAAEREEPVGPAWTPEEAELAVECRDRLDGLPKETADEVLEVIRQMSNGALLDEGTSLELVLSLPPSWLKVWKGELTKAERAVNGS